MRYYSTIKNVYFYVKKYIAHSCGGKPRVKEEEIAGELIHTLSTEYSIGANNLLAAMRD